jgi:hypothetical protein
VLGELNHPALEWLIAQRDALDPFHRSRIILSTAWPTTIVTFRNSPVGFLMPRVGKEYFARYGLRSAPKEVLLDWDRLVAVRFGARRPNIVSEVPDVSDEDVLMLLTSLAEILRALHAEGIVLGDLSGRNLLWSLRPSPRILLLDNDGFRRSGEPGITYPKETPGWEDPHLKGSVTTMASDVYKFGLVAHRAVFGYNSLSAELTAQAEALGGWRRLVADLVKRSTAATEQRPTAQDWRSALASAMRIFQLEGRPVIELGNHRGIRAAMQTADQGTTRPTIVLRNRQ